MAAPVIAAGAAASSSASAGSAAAGASSATASSTTALKVLRLGATVGTNDDNNYLGWLLGGLAGLVLLVLLLPMILVSAIFPATGGGGSPGEQIGPGSPIPAAFVPIFNQAGAVLDVNPYLLASVADQESTFGTGAGWSTVNYAGCVGFMQTCVGGAGGDSWDSTVTLTAHPAMTLAERFAYRLGTRPTSYPLQTQTHPNYNDPFDAVMAAAVEIRGKVGGRPIPNLDETAYQAACGYYGACADAFANYAQTVINRARLWESESALALAPGQQARILPDGSAAAPADAPLAVVRAIAAANEIHTAYYMAARPEALNTIYPWYDCSASTDYVLYNAGLNGPGVTVGGPFAGDSTDLESYGDPGPGRFITIYANPDHAFIVIAGLAFDTANWGGPNIPAGSGPRWRQAPTGNLADGMTYTARHPPGL